jgi:hypothetical protein
MTASRDSVKKGGTAEVTSCPFKGGRFFYYRKRGVICTGYRAHGPAGAADIDNNSRNKKLKRRRR